MFSSEAGYSHRCSTGISRTAHTHRLQGISATGGREGGREGGGEGGREGGRERGREGGREGRGREEGKEGGKEGKREAGREEGREREGRRDDYAAGSKGTLPNPGVLLCNPNSIFVVVQCQFVIVLQTRL